MTFAWQPNWPETRDHFLAWWRGEGLVLGSGEGPPAPHPHQRVPDPGPPLSIEAPYTEAEARALRNHYQLSRQAFPADVLPVSSTDIGPGSLSLALGSEPGFSPDTVWFNPCMEDDPHPEMRPPIRLDPQGRWWQVHEITLRACARLAGDNYAVGCPDLVENLDTLASLRGTQNVLVDMIEQPDWVLRKIDEINAAWFEAYDRVYEIIRLPDGGSVFGAFRLWAPGKAAKVQCDASAMISPAMFQRFVVPALAEQCEWLGHSMFHLDGAHCLCHLDALLDIDALDAIEWTPNPKVPSGGDPAWHDLYRRILAAGKSVQAVGVRRDEVLPLLDAVGGHGMYVMTSFESLAQAEEMARQIEPYR